MSLIQYNAPTFPNPQTVMEAALNLLWYGTSCPTSRDRVSYRIKTLHKESRYLQIESDKVKLLWLQYQKERERAGIAYAAAEEGARCALKHAIESVEQIEAVAKTSTTPLRPLPDRINHHEMNTQALALEDRVTRIKVAIQPFLETKTKTPLEHYHDLSQKTDQARVKFETFFNKEQEYHDQYNFLEARVESTKADIRHLQRTLTQGTGSSDTLALIDNFLEDEWPVDMDS